MQRDIGISPFQSKLQTHVVDIVYLAEMIYLQHMKESINLKYVSVNSSKWRHCTSTKDCGCLVLNQRVDVIFSVALTFVRAGKLDNVFKFLEICCILSWVQFLSFQWFPGRPEFPWNSRTTEMSMNEPRLWPAANMEIIFWRLWEAIIPHTPLSFY